ncbi:N-acetylmuramyl-L-alanine amidase, negative regulator of AmpC, AmpD [Jimgerdemannia flammicorona]|uniref:N-acetylmuramyl-L-alanine amidase, negative regulator of AmpC, AmpD n=1 Tax=Jimgerdemannia flammicorona TaxID=994334 RepID=A0A433DL90_9FUNG|nr:N-acetylmuramyl-L-alanine amidase, negative regulator of AmpC, AmpD [Jimgerdemannia flammicorona]
MLAPRLLSLVLVVCAMASSSAAAVVVRQKNSSTETYPNVYPPHIWSTADWGAKPPSSPLNILDHPALRILIHNTQGRNSPDLTQPYAYTVARQIQDLHMLTNGWADSGQHFTISRGGWILEGRHNTLSALSNGKQFVQSAHSPGMNTEAIGIECDGAYGSVLPTEYLFDSLMNLMASFLTSRVHQEPTLDRFAQYNFVSFRFILIYFPQTDCPGNIFYSVLGNIRSALSKRLNKPIVHSWPDLRPQNSGGNVHALQVCPSPPFLLPLAPKFRILSRLTPLFFQYLLNAHGSNISVDGKYGDATLASTKAFQIANSFLPADGYVRENTWRALIKTVRQGDTGNHVRAVQKILKRNGLGAEVTGTFDAATAAAVRTLQRWRGLTQDTIVGPETWCAVLGGSTPAEMALEASFSFGPVVVD